MKRSGDRISFVRYIFVFLALVLFCAHAGCAQKRPVVDKPVEGPVIVFDREKAELGFVKEGEEVPCSFTIRNAGNQTLEILETYASCGCTTPILEKNSLAPNESVKLDVVIDTSMKQDRVVKTVDVSSNDPRRPVVAMNISMTVENRHKGLNDAGKAKILTDAKCMSCHVAPGVGLFGKDLYDADCAMCHGQNARGASGPCLARGDYSNPAYAKYIRDVIAHGSKTHNSMPGFEMTSGGPLAREQVDSLVKYLGTLTKSNH